MIAQALSLLVDIGTGLTSVNYIMRCKESFGRHFTKLAKIVTYNIAYIRCENR
jgi:RNA processing factor Prp31